MSLMQSLPHFAKNPGQHQLKALHFLQDKGFPTKKDENWKYTSLKSWLEKDYSLAASSGAKPVLPQDKTFKLVFHNGCFKSDLSTVPDGVHISTSSAGSVIVDSFQALNDFLSPEFTVVKILKGTNLAQPLELLFLTNSGLSTGKVQVYVENETSVALLERHLQLDDAVSFSNVNVEIFVGNRCKLEFVQIQNQNLKSFHFEKTKITTAESSNILSLVMSLGALQARSELEVNIQNPHSEVHLLGLYALSAEQQSDHYTNIRHLVGGSHTEQVYKGLLDQKSKAVFNGGVYIAKDAQKANSEQLNKNLLLSSEAEVNSKPQLEIYADDVKAAHGSTIGQLQKEELFYLRSRGIKKSLAVQMLSQAFVMDLVERIENKTLKTIAEKSLRQKLEVMIS